MARYATISAIGARPPVVSADESYNGAVEIMLRHLTAQIEQVLPDQPDLVVLPEACDIPANYDLTSQAVLSGYIDARSGAVLRALARLARHHRCYVTYPSIRRLSDGSWRNSIELIDRNGEVVSVYDKHHPTIWENEAGILSGAQAVIASCDFGRIGFVICFDLNFDEIRARYVQARPDVLVFCSMYHGDLMQNYWAYTCRAHFAAAISGTCGSAHILSPLGKSIAASTNYYNYATARVNLDCRLAHLDYNWDRLRAMRKKHGRKVSVVDPGLLGSVLISSETDEFTVDDVIAEFQIETLDDYFARSLECQARHRPAGSQERTT